MTEEQLDLEIYKISDALRDLGLQTVVERTSQGGRRVLVEGEDDAALDIFLDASGHLIMLSLTDANGDDVVTATSGKE